ncbi:hypothetical protein [Qipengyuania citrea]|uniref:hypothetical protein n=1 Tax=Qipengyuania citrea TaxID=225971 RepID=UPI003298FB0D
MALLPLKRMSSLRMELGHALLGKFDQLVGCVGVFAVDYDVEGRLSIFKQEDEPRDVYGVACAGQWKSEPQCRSGGFRARAALCRG